MTTLIVKIELNNYTKDELEKALIKDKTDWFPEGQNKISVDEAYLELAEDDSFFLFNFVGIED